MNESLVSPEISALALKLGFIFGEILEALSIPQHLQNIQCHIVKKAGSLEAEGLLESPQSRVFLFTVILGKLFHLSSFFNWKMEIIIVTNSEGCFEYKMA